MYRLAAIVLSLGVLAGCAGDDEPISSAESDPTRDFEVTLSDTDTDWPIVRDTDVDTSDTDGGDTDTDGGDTDTDAG